MPEPILTTKLQPAPLREPAVHRPRLTAKLARAAAHRLTVIAAPAGFGKSTLLSAWLAAETAHAGWLALDSHDNVAPRFLRYLVAALQQIDSTIGSQALALLDSGHLPATETALATLINDLAATTQPAFLVLDDYHVIENPAIHAALDFLLAHAPPQLHLVLAGRTTPPLALARLRSQAQLLEIHAADLRFTATEIDEFLGAVMHLDLPPDDRIALEMRTEGWVAGLQLAALSLQDEGDKHAFITAFSGADRHIADYLFEEVLRHLSPARQRFLLHTSVADQLCAGLCDAINGNGAGQATLESLERANLFVVPLDHDRRWYRYHQLFLELLRHRLQQSYPDELPVLHGRASAWFEAQNRLDEAIHHALAAHDYDRAAVLLERYVGTSTWIRQNMDQLLDWFAGLPAVLFSTRPRLALGYAWLLFEIYADRWLDIETLLQQADHALATPAIASRLREPETQRMMAEVELLRANHARFRGDTAQVIEHCHQALARLPADERFVRSGVTAHLAAAHESHGDLTQAADLYRDSIRMCKAANNTDGLLFAAARLITVAPARGLLHQAESVFRQVQALSPARTGPDMGMVYVAIGNVYREQNQVAMAQRNLAKGIELCRPFPAWSAGVAAGNLALARLAAAQDDHSVALERLADAEQAVAESGPQEIARQIEAVRARLLLDQGYISPAIAWGRAHQQDVTNPAGANTTVQQVERLTLIRILLAQVALAATGVRTAALSPDPLATAAQLLAQSYDAARAGGQQGTLIEILLLQAQIDYAAAHMEQALAAVEEALILAAPEGYVQIFLDEAEPVRGLLTMLASRATGSPADRFLRTLLEAFSAAATPAAREHFLPGDSLTAQERKTLALLASERSTAAIADVLGVAVSTVRTYTKRIYSKLYVHSRAEAVHRARELGIL